MWFFHGNTEYAGKFQKKACEKEAGYDRCQQSEGRRSWIWNGYQCGDLYYQGSGKDIGTDVKAGGCRSASGLYSPRTGLSGQEKINFYKYRVNSQRKSKL